MLALEDARLLARGVLCWSILRSLTVAALFLCSGAYAQRSLSGAAAAQFAVERLGVTGSALMIAAHPDDENTALLAYLGRGRKVRTGYLSLTRGEGGQNLIGPEQGRLLGIIRTQELLAARRIDGAEQFFTRAVDFGYSKSPEEAITKWGRDQVLGDIVWVIRKFRPDVIILRFSGTARDGHGQHQASAMLGKEAFFAAADPKRFPDQLTSVQAWKAKRVLWNVFGFTKEHQQEIAAMKDKLEVDVGIYDPLLGYSFGEIAGQSRSMHHSQGMGSPQRRGPVKEYFRHVAGEPAGKDLFDGVAMEWQSEAGPILKQAAAEFDSRHPEKTIPLLLKSRSFIRLESKKRDLEEAIASCAGLWLDASATRPTVTAGEALRIRADAINRSDVEMRLTSVKLDAAGGTSADIGKPLTRNVPVQHVFEWKAHPPTGDTSVEQPEPNPIAVARFQIAINGHAIEFARPVIYRYVDNVYGELTRPLAIVPPVAVSFIQPSTIFPSAAPRDVDVRLRSFTTDTSGQVTLGLPPGWRSEPASIAFKFEGAGEETITHFRVTPPDSATSIVQARAEVRTRAGSTSAGIEILAYPHIPTQVVQTSAASSLSRADAVTLSKRIGYVMGAGDLVAESLRQLGAEVTLLTSADLASGDLSRYDTIVTGVRAYNVRDDLRANQHRLMEFVRNGGTVVVQYNVLEGGFTGGNPAVLNNIGPFPLTIGRQRVSVEEAPVTFVRPDHPLLSRPNKITQADFQGWVQERGLYFASKWDPKYEPMIASADPGEELLPGGLLYARIGKGAYVFTAYSWFRQLPAGVPGAYRIFANLLSAGQLQ